MTAELAPAPAAAPMPAPVTYPNGYQEQLMASGPLAETTLLLGSDPRVLELPANQQGAFIVDRFIGGVVAEQQRGTFDGKTRERNGQAIPLTNAREVLTAVDNAGNISDARPQWQDNLPYITRAGGLRAATDALLSDDRIGPMVGTMRDRLPIDSEGRPVLDNIHQLEGYLYGISGNQAATWQATILGRVSDYAQRSAATPQVRQSANWHLDVRGDLLSSNSAIIRASQQEWDAAAAQAQQAGVDMDMIVRTAEHMADDARVARSAGGMAVVSVVAPPPGRPYRSLFSA